MMKTAAHESAGRFFGLPFWYLVLFLMTAATGTSQSVSPRLEILEIDGLWAAGKTAAARQRASEILARDSEPPGFWLALGQILGRRQELELAGRAFRRAAEQTPDSLVAHFNLGLTLYQAKQPAEARTALERALELAPSSFEVNYLLGAVLSDLGEKHGSILRLRAARAARPGHAGVSRLLGLLYLDSGYPVDAAEILVPLVETGTKDESLSLLLVQTHHALFDFDKALELAATVARQFPQSANARFRLGFELQSSGRFPEAEGVFVETLLLDPGHVEASLALGHWNLKTGRAAEAIGHFETVLGARPGDVPGRLGLARALLGAKQHGKAKEALLALAVEMPAEPSIRLWLSQSYQAEGDRARSDQEREAFLRLSRRAVTAGGMSSQLAGQSLRRFSP